MESFFSSNDALRATAANEIDRKVLTSSLLLFRRIFLWASLPLLLTLGCVAGGLIYFYLAVQRGEAEVTIFREITDIFSLYTGSIVLLITASLCLVKVSDKKLVLLSSLRPDETDCDDPVAAFPAPLELAFKGTSAESSEPHLLEDNIQDDVPNPPETDDGRQSVSSRSAFENAG